MIYRLNVRSNTLIIKYFGIRKMVILLADQNYCMYQLACEASPHKQKIDAWINEGKSNTWISEQLKELGGYISVASVSKYRKHRDEMIMKELEETPEFQAKQMMVTEEFQKSVAKIQKVDLLANLSELINDSADMLADAKERGIQINSVKDMRMIQQTMLDAISTYGETMLNAQKYAEIQNDPSLLGHKNTTININIRDTLVDILKGEVKDGSDGYQLIDRLRAGIGKSN